jgi:hypothetical protein
MDMANYHQMYKDYLLDRILDVHCTNYDILN